MRRTIEPYLSGDTFRLNCDYILDETNFNNWPDLSLVKENSSIFVKTDYLPLFYILSKNIKEKFVLVTHNSDYLTNLLTDEQCNELLSKCKWFGQNNNNNRINSIPIGIANAQYPHGNPDNIFRLLPSNSDDLYKLFYKSRLNMVFMSIKTDTNKKVRETALKHFTKLGIVNNNNLAWHEYICVLQNTYFCVCPEGNGPDTHRIWEALYSGCIPIALSTTTPDLLKDLPVLQVDNWESITIDKLVKHLEEIRKGTYKFEKLFYPYWKNKLLEN